MKKFLSILLVVITVFHVQSQDSLQHTNTLTSKFIDSVFYDGNAPVKNGVPELNRKIVETANSLLDTMIEKGVCQDFVSYVLSRNNAGFNENNTMRIKDYFLPDAHIIFPGDIIILDRVKFFLVLDTLGFSIIGKYRHHIAIIHHRIDEFTFGIIDQTKGNNIKIKELPLEYMYKGKITILRPMLEGTTANIYKPSIFSFLRFW